LDAPLVAVAWLYMLAATWRVDYLPWQAAAALAGAVWVIYVADRLRDARRRMAAGLPLERRHGFHWEHRGLFMLLALVVGLITVRLALFSLPPAVFSYGLLGMVFVGGFFMLGSKADRGEVPYLKNILAGLAFAYGTAMTAHVFMLTQHIGELFVSKEMLSFAVLCIVNITAIDVWEHSRASSDAEVKAEDEFSLTLPLALLAGAMLLFAMRSENVYPRPFYYSILIAAAALQILNKNRQRFSLDLQRVLADVCLLLPFPLFFILRA
jgi:hypothetical protein